MNNDTVINTIEIVKKKLKKYTDLKEHEKVKIYLYFKNLILIKNIYFR